jgi:hypothetical protein
MLGQVVAVRKLPSGDSLITLDTEETREIWLKDTKWLAIYGRNARVKRREFVVLAHGIKVNQVQDQAKAKQEIYNQNPKLRGIVEILRVTWSKKLIRSGRTSGPLQVSVAEPEQANLLIRDGLIWDYQIHECEPYSGECTVTQCFQCYQYGHVARMCRNTPRCGFCAAPGYATNDCIAKEDRAKHQCVSCGKGSNHTSWARECPVHERKVEAATMAYKFRPHRFQVRKESGMAGVSPARSPSPTFKPAVNLTEDTSPGFTFTAGMPGRSATEPPSNGWMPAGEQPWRVVQSKRTPSPGGVRAPPAKRGRGRPLGSTRASRNTKDIRSFSLNSTR